MAKRVLFIVVVGLALLTLYVEVKQRRWPEAFLAGGLAVFYALEFRRGGR